MTPCYYTKSLFNLILQSAEALPRALFKNEGLHTSKNVNLVSADVACVSVFLVITY